MEDNDPVGLVVTEEDVTEEEVGFDEQAAIIRVKTANNPIIRKHLIKRICFPFMSIISPFRLIFVIESLLLYHLRTSTININAGLRPDIKKKWACFHRPTL
jgi:hypothetical protein